MLTHLAIIVSALAFLWLALVTFGVLLVLTASVLAEWRVDE